jgi:hypothetical protein
MLFNTPHTCNVFYVHFLVEDACVHVLSCVLYGGRGAAAAAALLLLLLLLLFCPY